MINSSLLKKMRNNYLVTLLITIILCYVTSNLGLLLSGDGNFVALVWPPAGIAIILLLYFGYRIWPGIYIGTLFTSAQYIETLYTQPTSIMQHLEVFFVASGATFQALAAVWIVKRFNLFDHDFSDPKKIGIFYFVIGPLCSFISATVALITYTSFGIRTIGGFSEEWVLWYFSDSSSAIIFSTLIFSFIKFKQRRRNIINAFILMGIVFAYGILFIGKNWEEERLDLIFNQKVTAATDTLEQFIAAHVSLDNNLKGFMDYLPELQKYEFMHFADNNLVEGGNVRSIAWIVSIDSDQRHEFEKELSLIHGKDISLWQTGEDLTQIPAKIADTYTAVKLLEPYDKLGFVVGHVIGIDKARDQAMKHALMTGQPALSAPVVLLSNPGAPTAATIYRAHMKNGELEGFTAIAIRINAMVSRLQGHENDKSFYVDLFDKEEGPHLTFKSYKSDDVNVSNLKSQTIELPILNRTWVIKFTRTPEFTENNKTSQPLFIAIAGVIFASLMTVGIVLISGQRIFLENVVAQRTKDLEKANQAKTEFMANMSHDLRTPLNAIIGFSEIMTKEMFGKLGSEKYLEYSKDINQSSAYLLSLISDILDMSAIDADQRVLDLEDFDLKMLIDECARSLNPLIDEKEQVLSIKFEDDFPIVRADKRSVQQILINLISNAIKFAANAGKIDVDSHFSSSSIFITVRDNGQGIASENIDTILDPFSRVNNHPHLSQEGTGLGLAIVNSLVKLHGGKLTIKSELNIGTEITIELPRP